ncbi:hypothetical protein TWF696_003741 [Orbilia brochopaga]|uniref:Uncharacterized protein n=1 Tax=Orbilia brochopaga TaxID=3140254 RepID=A0AAV9V4N9_9PEZI
MPCKGFEAPCRTDWEKVSLSSLIIYCRASWHWSQRLHQIREEQWKPWHAETFGDPGLAMVDRIRHANANQKVQG